MTVKKCGRVEINAGEEGRTTTQTLATKLRDSNTTYVPSTETRSVIGKYERNGEDTVEEDLKEVKEHEKIHEDGKCDNIEVPDIDGDATTISEKRMEELVNVVMEKSDDKVEEAFGENDVKTLIKKKFEEYKNSPITEEEIIEKIVEELETEVEHIPTRGEK